MWDLIPLEEIHLFYGPEKLWNCEKGETPCLSMKLTANRYPAPILRC